ncbi:MAG: phosphonate ABC transporter ATP-binding protein [Flammeovirgaceae bacterium]|nr:phosphonate ABC transporter ATP-binding protein [Flammeovirgaceae bacterium]
MINDINTVIDIKDASIFHRYNTILNDVNFKIKKGEFVYIIGKTGSGKSSLLKTIYGDLILKMGSINVVGHEMKNIKKSKLPFIRRKLGIIFQDFQLFQDRSIADNLIFVMKATGWKKNIINDNVLKLLSKVGLEDKANRYPHQLSGGEQQRAVIARALINNPIILIADEPTGNLDPKVSENIFKLFLEINKKGTTILMATHNYELIKKFNNRTLNCIRGKVEEININNI